MTRRKRKLLTGLAILALVLVILAGIWWSRRGAVTVQASEVTRENLTAVVTASGQIEPENYANVNADSIGRITDIYVKEGDRVKKGQLLLKTEDIQQQADVDAQDAALETSQADQEATQAAVQSAAAAVKTAQADLNQAKYQLTQKTLAYNRGLELFKASLIAKQDFDQRLCSNPRRSTSKRNSMPTCLYRRSNRIRRRWCGPRTSRRRRYIHHRTMAL